jgi:hypothetical protein
VVLCLCKGLCLWFLDTENVYVLLIRCLEHSDVQGLALPKVGLAYLQVPGLLATAGSAALRLLLTYLK